jgi:hypothetical protein
MSSYLRDSKIMEMIPADLVEETWREVGSSSTAQAKSLMNRLGKSQNNLLSFVVIFTQELEPDAHGLAVYLFTVIFRIFEKASSGRIRRVRQGEIVAAYERTEQFVEKFIGAHERFLEAAAISLTSTQPFVMQYLLEALLEAPEEEEPVILSDEDSGQIFLVLSTAIGLIDRAASRTAR